jgi:thioredoxin-related protein
LKIIKGILILALASSSSCNNSKNDNFYERALKNAENNHKFVLLDFTAPWCGACRLYDNYVFRDSSIAAKLAEKFLLLKITTDKPENSFLVRKYNLQGIPHIYLIDGKERTLGSVENFYPEFVENPDSFIVKLESIINAQEKLKTLESAFARDTTSLEAIYNLLGAYESVGQYIGIQRLNNLLITVDPTPKRLFEHNFTQVILSLKNERNIKPLLTFIKANPKLDEEHKSVIYTQLLYYYRDQEDIKNQDIYYKKLLKMYPDYYVREYAEFLFENKIKIDTAIMLANKFNSKKAYRNSFWGQFLNAHSLAYSGKIRQAIEKYGDWMENNKQMLVNNDKYWAFYFYAKFANCHNVDLERALEYIQITERKRNMLEEKVLMAEIFYKLGRTDESVGKLKESLELANGQNVYNKIIKLIEKYRKGGMPLV